MARKSARLLAGLVATGGSVLPLLGASPARAESLPICFPVFDAPVQYSSTFGAPRGDTRTHEGDDIMGAPMYRIVAAADGVILSGRDGIRWRGTGDAEHSLRMRGDDGHYYAYLHLNDDTPGTDDDSATYEQVFGPGIVAGVRVRKGQLIGYMGDSGNAGEGNDHLHFEIREAAPTVWDSTAIDPYDSLRSAEAAGRCPLHGPPNPFVDLGGILTSSPDAASVEPGKLDVMVRGTDDQLWHRRWTGTEFTPWMPLGGILLSGPGVASMGAGRLAVAVRGTDDQLWLRIRTNETWGQWLPLGGTLRSDPDLTSSGAGDLTVVVRGTDDAVWTRTYSGGSWNGWTTLGGSATGSPTAVSTGPGQVRVYVRGTDQALWGRTGSGGSWGAWRPLGGVLPGDPDATAEGTAPHIVVRGTDGRIWTLTDWWGESWHPLGTVVVGGDPSITSWAVSRLDLFVAGPTAGLLQTWSDTGGW